MTQESHALFSCVTAKLLLGVPKLEHSAGVDCPANLFCVVRIDKAVDVVSEFHKGFLSVPQPVPINALSLGMIG